MLSVAQAVRHSETPGSASKHAALSSWSSERPNVLKRRKTDSDSLENLSHHYNINNQEITLTVIPKNSNQSYNELFQGKIKTLPFEEQEDIIVCDNNQPSTKGNSKIPINVPPTYRSLFENSKEIQLTKLGSNESVKVVEGCETLITKCNDNYLSINTELPSFSPNSNTPTGDLELINPFSNASSLVELSEVTIEPCTKPKEQTNIESKESKKVKSRIQKATELLQQKQKKAINPLAISSPNEKHKNNVTNVPINSKSNFPEGEGINSRGIGGAHNNYETIDCFDAVASIFDETTEPSLPSTSASDYEPFNVGIPCERFYESDRDKPHYATGFPNPPGENRCWTNATLQTLFTLPILDSLDSLDIPDCSKLMQRLINVQALWRAGNTKCRSFDTQFTAFKEELSALDTFYSSRAQQDVSEFLMSLLNFIKTEFNSQSSKESQSNERENIPNNDQDALRRPQNNSQESNKRLPLAEISAASGQIRNTNFSAANNNNNNNNSLQDPKIDSSVSTKNDEEDNEEICNPIDEYFSLYMAENYICDGCSKQRQQSVENLMLYIDLPVENDGKPLNLVDVINKSYALEHRNMTCESCKHDCHSMVTTFKKLPKILTVQVKRYEVTPEGSITKKSTAINVPALLKLDSLVINNRQDFSYFPEYEPIGIISHIGDNIDSGHYISFVKHQDQWFYYDDMNVKLLSDEEVFKSIQNNAYVIFFQDTELSRSTNTTHQNKNESIIC